MADSVRKQIRLALVARLQEIRTTAGYHTDGGLHVRHGEPLDTSQFDPPVAIGLVKGDPEIEGEPTLERTATFRWPFTARGAIYSDPERPLDLPGEDLLADLKRAIFQRDAGSEKVTLGGLVDDIEAAPGEQVDDRSEAGQDTATCGLPFVVLFQEGYGAP